MFVIAVGALVYEIIMIHNSYQQYKEIDDTNDEIISTYTKDTSKSPTVLLPYEITLFSNLK